MEEAPLPFYGVFSPNRRPLGRCAGISAVLTDYRQVFPDRRLACIDADASLGLNGRMPGGACRQWLLELAPDAELIVAGETRVFTVRELLPHGFEL